ncbi:extracellular solute-binding protein [Nakamurella deserti]|uniref:extracellular solute-binding protein n=1 Tax=Nakamurella deserti TaxID=2164074 RepID=UPI000DBE5F11|nr:extracellular solute-binding protein [Nakamurella deserti]
MRYAGITWDHPRGRNALVAAADRERAAGSGLDIVWKAHSLEHFESFPIDELARDHDLIVLDHPHLGEALEHGSLIALDTVVDPAVLARWRSAAVGPSFASYAVAGAQWAVPLDAATQVAVSRTALLAAPPHTWEEVRALSAEVPVALSLAGPHAYLTFASICAAHDEPCDGDDLVSDEVALTVLDLMSELARRAPAGTAVANPIALLERLRSTTDIAYCPLVYGYVTYSSADVRFSDAPVATAGGRHGSTLGGTGLALSRRAVVTPELVRHIEWLMGDLAQTRFIPQHDGQPSARLAWLDPDLDESAAGFYRATLATVSDAWVRPRHAGFIRFQTEASAVVRDIVDGTTPPRAGLAALRDRYRHSLARTLPEKV